ERQLLVEQDPRQLGPDSRRRRQCNNPTLALVQKYTSGQAPTRVFVFCEWDSARYPVREFNDRLQSSTGRVMRILVTGGEAGIVPNAVVDHFEISLARYVSTQTHRSRGLNLWTDPPFLSKIRDVSSSTHMLGDPLLRDRKPKKFVVLAPR